MKNIVLCCSPDGMRSSGEFLWGLWLWQLLFVQPPLLQSSSRRGGEMCPEADMFPDGFGADEDGTAVDDIF